MTVARVALPAATGQAFDYWIPDGIGVARGSIVRVRLANRRHVGVVVETAATSGVDLCTSRQFGVHAATPRRDASAKVLQSLDRQREFDVAKRSVRRLLIAAPLRGSAAQEFAHTVSTSDGDNSAKSVK